MIDPVALLVAYVTARCGAAEVEVRWLGADLAGAEQVVFSGDACRAHPDLEVLLVRGGAAERVRIRPELAIRVPGPVAARAAAAGEAVEIVPGTIALADRVGSPVEGEGWVARTTIAAGDPVTTAVVSKPPDARSGTAVLVVAERGAVRLVAEGVLLEDARVGETVRVACEATRGTVRAELVAPDRVEVR